MLDGIVNQVDPYLFQKRLASAVHHPRKFHVKPDVSLPASSAAVLIAISIVITVIGGLLPAKKAALKDPVIALRTE